MPVVGRELQSVQADDSSTKAITCTAGDTLYYGSGDVSSGVNDGSLTVGQSVEVSRTTWLVSASTSRYEVRPVAPPSGVEFPDGSAALVVSRPVVIDARDHGVIADNSTPCGAFINAAMAAARGSSYGSVADNDKVGAIVQLPPGRINVNDATVTIPANVELRGHGPSSTYICRSGGELTTPVIKTATTGVQQVISDLGVINSVATVDGLNVAGGGGASILADMRVVVRDVVIVGGARGVVSLASDGQGNELRCSRVMTMRTRGDGFTISTTDFFLENCTAAQAGTGAAGGATVYGFNINGNNGRVYGCKAYGQLGDFGAGFVVADRNMLSCCEAQDCKGDGFVLGTNATGVVASACVADGCDRSGFLLRAGAVITACVAQVRSGALYTTDWALDINNGDTDIQVRGFKNYGCTRLYFPAATKVPVGSFLDLSNRFGAQSKAYAATITPDPWAGSVVNVAALTGGVTIANPATAPDSAAASVYPVGMELVFVLPQDATGGRTVSFGTNYVLAGGTAVPTTASSVTTVVFVHDGSKWREKSRATS